MSLPLALFAMLIAGGYLLKESIWIFQVDFKQKPKRKGSSASKLRGNFGLNILIFCVSYLKKEKMS